MIIKTINYGKKGKKSCICECDICKKVFRKKFSEATRMKHHYCSLNCLYKMRSDRTIPSEWREKISKALKGRIVSEETKRKLRESHPRLRGKDNPNWRGGRYQSEQGYWIIRVDGKRIGEHRYIMEQFLGKKLENNEFVHHIDNDKSNNNIENLELLSQVEHNHKHKIFSKRAFYNQCFIEYLNFN